MAQLIDLHSDFALRWAFLRVRRTRLVATLARDTVLAASSGCVNVLSILALINGKRVAQYVVLAHVVMMIDCSRQHSTAFNRAVGSRCFSFSRKANPP